MAGAPWSKVKFTKAGEITGRFELSQEGAALLDARTAPPAFLDELCDAGLMVDAVRFVAHALPVRESVWWACVCVRRAQEFDLGEGALEDPALAAAEEWVLSPTEVNRRAARTAAEAAEYETPGAWAAMAAFWSRSEGGGKAAKRTADDGLLGAAVAGAVMLAAARFAPEGIDEAYREFLTRGADIAAGGTGTGEV